ncbi:MAG: twin-arginine translocase TatA/TatE family subunit [Desulfobacterales bacterium]|nr:twin-arginine translocase TatA/TatE family subunit [Desulfobacterales bacterium]
MFGLGTAELIVIGVLVFLIFGAKRIPEIGKGLGGALREFRQIKKDVAKSPETKDKNGKEPPPEEKEPRALENKLAQKVLEQAPGVKKVMDVKKKIDKVKDLINS